MASINYCFTVCRAADEKVQQETHPKVSSDDVQANSNSSNTGAYFFGRFFSFGSSSTSQLTNPFTIKASNSTTIDEN